MSVRPAPSSIHHPCCRCATVPVQGLFAKLSATELCSNQGVCSGGHFSVRHSGVGAFWPPLLYCLPAATL